jgi:signal transduction histidine kinase
LFLGWTNAQSVAQENLRLTVERSDTSETWFIDRGEIPRIIETIRTDERIYIEELQDDGSWLVISDIDIRQNRTPLNNPWVLIGLIALICFIAYLTFRFFLNKSRKDAIMEAKFAHLERSALQAQMNPHFIFNSLNSIQSYIASNENEKANRFLAKFSRLIRAMLNNSRSNQISLQDEIDTLQLYLDLEKMRFKDKFEFEIVVDEIIDAHRVQVPPLLIQPYVENAIIHGLAQTRSHGRINIYYIKEGKYLHATVTDNGIGIEQHKKQKKGQSLHKSVGMTITQKRLQMLDESSSDRKVLIEEIISRKGEVLGTKVEVKIKID